MRALLCGDRNWDDPWAVRSLVWGRHSRVLEPGDRGW